MGLRLKKARLEIKPEASKVNVVKRFGAHFRKAFSKKKQSQTLPPKEAFVQEFQPAISKHPNLFPQEEGRSLEKGEPGVVQVHIGVEKNPQTPKLNLADNRHGTGENTPIARDFGLAIGPRGFVVTTPPEPAGFLNESVVEELQQGPQRQDRVEAGSSTPLSSTSSSGLEISIPRYPGKARRSSCPPPCTSSSDSNHSSETLFSTPRHSEASSSPTFTEFRRSVDKPGSQDKECWLVLAEYLKSEEQENQDTKWEVVVEWMKFAHQMEVAELKSQVFVAETMLAARDVELANEKDDHDADLKTIETLKKERSDARKRLSEQSRELRSTKKELRNLKKSIEEIREQLSDDGSSAEHGDMEEGGVRLTEIRSRHMAEVHESRKDPDAGVRVSGTTGSEVNAEEPLSEGPGPSTPQAAAAEEVKEQAMLLKASGVNDGNEGPAARIRDLEIQNKTLNENLEYATEEVARLRSEVKAAQDEAKKLRAENHFAQLEVGHLHAVNAMYRSEKEDTNPARTAHIDGLLKRKDEAYTELEMRAADCDEQLAEEKKNRAIDNVYAKAKISGLNTELAHQSNMVAALTEGRDILKKQKDEIFQMFKKKIFPSDVDEAFRHDYDVVQKDNTLLVKMINERRYYLEDAEKPVADLQADKLILESAAKSDQLKQQQLQQYINGLEAEKGDLNNKVKIQTELREEAEEELNGRIKQQAGEIERLLNHGAEDGWRRLFQTQAQEITNCRREVTRLAGLAEQWRMRAAEVRDDFCPMLHFAEVRDWTAEESRWRLHHAERRAAELEKRPAELEKQLAELERKFRDAVRDGKRPEDEGSKLPSSRVDAAKASEELSNIGGRI